MSVYKKRLLRNTVSKLNNRLVSWHVLGYRMTSILGVATVGVIFSALSAPTHTQLHVEDTSSKKHIASSVRPAQTTIPAVVVVPKVTTPKVTTISTTSLPVATTKTVTAPTQPVVIPSPASSVSGLTPTATPASSPTPNPQAVSSPAPTTGYTSTNWSGYLATNGSFTAISGSWNVPVATGNGPTTSADSTWIGIGGVTTSDLIQIGTQNIISTSGQVTTAAFYEILPSSSQPIAAMTVSLGDSMTASINETSNGQWALSIVDNTDKASYTTNLSYTSSLSSAEWIEEDPSYSFRRQIPFDNFHGAAFTGGSTMDNNASLTIVAASAQPVTMVNSDDQTIAEPSALGSDGMSFSVSP
jgi:hypothetical protein